MRDVSDRASPHDRGDQRRIDVGREPGFDADRALARLEDVLLATPFDRALPDLEDLLRDADVPLQLLWRDDRALKVVQEAIVARPFGELESVHRTRAEVELLTLEVEVLTDRLLGGPDVVTFERVTTRMREVRARLDEIRREL